MAALASEERNRLIIGRIKAIAMPMKTGVTVKGTITFQSYQCGMTPSHGIDSSMLCKHGFAHGINPGITLQQRGEPLHRQPDDVGEAAADDRDERVAILHAVATRLTFPSARVEIGLAFAIAQGLETNDADLDGADPFVAVGAVEADPGDHLGVAPFLESDHPLGVGRGPSGLLRISPATEQTVSAARIRPCCRRRATSAAFRQASCAA